MAQAGDVRRLLSWLKMEDFNYREFAAPAEASDAAAAWPALYEAASAAGTGHLLECTMPAGDAAAKRRIARDRATLAPGSAEPRSPAEPAGRVNQTTTGKDGVAEASEREGARLGAALRQRLAAAGSGRASPTIAEPPPASPPDMAEATFAAAAIGAGYGAPQSERKHREAAETTLQSLPAEHSAGRRAADGSGRVPTRGGAMPPVAPGHFLGGMYRGSSALQGEEGTEASGPGDKALQAVFARLSRDRDDDGRTLSPGRLPGRLR